MTASIAFKRKSTRANGRDASHVCSLSDFFNASFDLFNSSFDLYSFLFTVAFVQVIKSRHVLVVWFFFPSVTFLVLFFFVSLRLVIVGLAVGPTPLH